MLLLFALLAQTATPDNVVKTTPTGDTSYMLELITTESAGAAYKKIQAAAAEACKATGVASMGMIIGGTVSRKPERNQILQPVQCKPATP
jgi:hypothetical protein